MQFRVFRSALAGCIAAALLLSVPTHAKDFTLTAETVDGKTVSNGGQVTVTAIGPQNVFSTGMLQVPGAKLPAYFSLVGKTSYLFISNSKKTTSNDASKDPSGCGNNVGKPIQVSTGTSYETYPLFQLPGEMGLSYILYYNTSFIGGWSDNLSYGMDLQCGTDPNICKYITYGRPDGSSLIFDGKPGVGPFTERGGGGLATLSYNASTGVYTLHDEDATTKTFVADVYGQAAHLTSITNPSGIGWTVATTNANGVSTWTVTHTNGRSYTIVSGPGYSHVVNGQNVWSSPVTYTDPAGNVYSSQTDNSLDTLTFPGTPTTVINFKGGTGTLEVDYNGVPYDYTTFITTPGDPHLGWANGNYLADNTEGVFINYGTDSAGNLQATLTNSLGHQSTQTYDGTNGSGGVYNGYLSLISDTAVATCSATTHGRAYDANGNLSEVIDNNGNIHTYNYAANGQLQTETEAYGTPQARTTDYVWDPNQQLNRLLSVTVEGWQNTTYTYNAQNRIQSVAVKNLSANGLSNQTLTTTYNYTLYGNGMVQSVAVTNPSPNGSDTTTTQYDSYGNITTITNGLGQTTTSSNYNALGEVGRVVGPNGDVTDYTYDARGRVATKTTYPNGSSATWTYGYDGFGKLYTLSGPDGQVTTWNRDPSSMRVTSIAHNDKDGTSTESFSYDANGDVLEHKVTRGAVVGLDENFHYDALGRVYQKLGQNGQSLTYAYDGNGNVSSVTDATGHSVVNQYDALNRVTQVTESGGASPPMPTTAPTINVPSSNTTGTYTVNWNSIAGATFYVLQEKVGSGGWSTVQSSSAITWSPANKTTNTYSYQVKACNSTGCSPFSSTGAINVAIPTAPTSAPGLTVPSSSANGNYTVSWTAVPTAGTYTLQEQVNGGTWNTIQSGTSLSWSVNGRTNGTYAYRSEACNGLGCGPWSNTGTMVVAWPPIPAAPAISVPGRNYNGSYTVSWSSVANGVSYPLYQSVNGGSWTLVQNSGATSWTVGGQGDGQYNYLVSACDISGCGSQSGGAVLVIIPTPIGFNGLSLTGSYAGSTGTGNEGVGFDIVNGNTWEVFHTIPGNTHVVITSGPLPYGASTAQFTWTDQGVPAGMTNAAGSITSNQASSPVSIASNPSTMYLTGTFSMRTANAAHQWGLRVDFFDTTGVNISSSSGTLTGEVLSTL